MTALARAVAATDGIARYVRFGALWATAGLLADTLPLDRPATYPLAVRRVGHWLRLVLWDRALTNREQTAVLVIGRTPWAAACAAAAGAAMLTPRSPAWQRRLLVALGATIVLRRRRILDELALRRSLREAAPGGLLIGDLVARSPRAALPWVNDILRTLDARQQNVTFVAILPGARRDSARERIYTRMLGFEVVSRGVSRDRSLTLLVRRPPVT